MTRHLEGRPIPKAILCPSNDDLGASAREAIVYGVSVLDNCPNPDCMRDGPLDALLLGPLNQWPNIVAICGPKEDGCCGNYWALIGTPPRQTTWLHIEDDPTEEE